jgi:hypothetical protein
MLLKKIEQLSRELAQVKRELASVKASGGGADIEALKEQQEETAEALEELSDSFDTLMTDGVGRFEFFGDYRFRLDSTRAHVAGHYNAMEMMGVMQQFQQGLIPPAQLPAALQGTYHGSDDISNDLLYTNRLRLGMKVKASDNLTFKGRLAMYKIWGHESARVTAVPFGMNGYMMDANISRRPNDNTLRVEMAYVNWTNIAGLPIWFSIGRRPTVDGPPAQLRYNYDSRYATPVALGVDWTFDGLTLGYMYTDPWPGKIRICYGRGLEAGFDKDYNPYAKELDDVDLYGISWDIINDTEAHRFANLQFFRAADVPDTMEAYDVNTGQWMNPTANLGDIYHASFVYMDQIRGIDWFISGGLSRTVQHDTTDRGMGLLNSNGEDENHWGWAAYAGVRIPFESIRSKLGMEYNFGSEYWITFTPASDDLYSSKLATRGHVAEVYWIWDLPETPLSKYAKAFMRFGYQYYWFNYTGSGNWVGEPVDMDDLRDMENAQMWAPVDRMDNFYLTFEVYF